MSSHILKFGDLVIIQGSIQPNQLNKKDNKAVPEITGFLTAVGFTDNKIFLQTVPQSAATTADQLKVASTWSNYRDQVFQVWPKVSYEAHKQLKKLNKEKALMANLSEEARTAFDEKMKKLKGRVEEEIEGNQRMISHVMGQPVVYGAEMQLMHFNSRSFLTARVACSDSDKSAYKFELVNEFNSGMAFKFMPRYQIRQEGDSVQLQDQVLLYSMKLDCFVNFTNEKVNDPEEKIDPRLPLITAPFEHRQLPKGPQRFEAHVSQFRDCVWRVHYYGKHKDESEPVVRGGDLIKLKHTEIDAFLAADVPMVGKAPEVYGRYYYGEYEEEGNSINTIWEVELEEHQQRGGNCRITENPAEPKTIRLRHLLTGKLLGFEGNVAVVVRDDQKAPNVIFRSFANSPTDELLYNVAYGIGVSNEKAAFKYVRAHDENDYVKDQVTKQAPNQVNKSDEIKVFRPLEDSEFATKKRFMMCENPEPNAEHAFMVLRVSPEEQKNIGFAASSVYTLKSFVDAVKACKSATDVRLDLINATKEVLKALIFFVHKEDDAIDENCDPVEYEGITVQEKQRLLKDFRIIELLTEILYFPFYRKLFSLDNIEDKNFVDVFQLCYRLIKHTIKEYRPNEIYASQWLENYMEQAMKSNAENDIKAEATLIELIDNNKKILATKINKEMIAKFVEMLKENRNEKFVNLLRALCVCDGAAVVKNQTVMSQYIIEVPETRNVLIYQEFQTEGDQIKVRVRDYEAGGGESWLSLSGFEKVSKETDQSDKFKYFISMIYLLSDLCLERNYIAIDFLEKVYTYDICYKIITDAKSSYEVRSAFAKLITNLWIDKAPYQPLNVPQYLILWDEINPESCSQIACAPPEANARGFDGLKNYLKAYYGGLAKEGCTQIYEEERNLFTSIALELTIKLVEFGFYTSLSQLSELVKPLLVLLNGMKDVSTPQEFEEFKRKLKNNKKHKRTFIATTDVGDRNNSRYEENERNIVVMNSKNQICQLLKVIMNIDGDLRLRKFLLEFKSEIHGKDKNDFSEMRDRSPDKRSLFSKLKGNDDGAPVDYAKTAQQWIEKISQEKPIDFQKLAPTNFVQILFDLCLYEHEDLVHNAYELLYLNHSQRLRLKEMLEDVYVLEDQEKKKAVNAIEGQITILQGFAETTEKWYGKKDAPSLEQSKECIKTIKKIENFLFNDSLLLKGQNPEPDAEIVSQNKLRQNSELLDDDEGIVDEDQVIDTEFQAILRHLKVHEPLIEILKYETTSTKEERNEQRAMVLKEVCRLLSKFVHNAKANQALLVEDMPIYLNILKDYNGCGVEELIEKLFKDNRTLIRQVEQVEKFSKALIKIITDLKPSNSKSAKMLLSLEPLMRYKKTVIKSNQTAILSLLTLKDNAEIFITMKTHEKLILSKLADFNSKVKNMSNTALIDLPPEIDYVSALLEIMAYTCDGKNAVTESRSQSSWPLKDLAILYDNADNCWSLKRSILLFVYHVYLDTERGTNQKDDMQRIIIEMIKDMETVIHNYHSQYEIRYHRGTIDNKAAQEKFYFEALLPCVGDIITKKFYTSIQNYQQKLTDMLNFILQMKLLPVTRSQRRKLKLAIEKFRLHTHDIYKTVMEANDKAEGIEIPDMTADMSKRISVLAGSSSARASDDTKNLKLKARLSMLDDREEFMAVAEDEFEEMIRTLIEIEKYGEQDVFSTMVPFNDLIKSLIGLVDISGTTLRKDLMLVGLKTFRKIVERENRDNTKSAAEWDGDDWSKYEKKIIERQNQLCNLGLPNMICNTLSQTKDPDLQNECILVGIALLYGGNTKVQKAFLECIQNDAQNQFLYHIRKLIEKNFDLVKKEMSLRNKYYLEQLYKKEEAALLKQQIKSPKTPNLPGKGSGSGERMGSSGDLSGIGLDDDDDDNPTGGMPDNEEANQSLTLLQRTYRLLQLFCEGHNLQLQNILRSQTDKNGVVNGKSQDFITLTAHYFNTLIKQINVDSLDFGVQMLDFLIEALQGPCAKNQQVLAKAKIINSCMDFLTTFKQERDYHKQGFTEASDIAKVNDATTTALKLLNTLIEGSSDPEIVEEMDSLDFKFLIFKLSQEYQTFVQEKLKLNAATVKPSDVTSRLTGDSFNQQILESFDIYILMANLAEKSPKVASFLKDDEDYTQLEKDALEFFKTNLGNIELMFNEALLKIYFPIYPICRYLSRDSRKDLMQNVNRDSPNEKVMGLVNAAPELFDEMEHMAYLQSQIFVFNKKRYNHLRDLSTILSLVINIIILCTEYYVVASNKTYLLSENIGELNSERAIDVLGYIQIGTSSLMILFWVIINVPIVLKQKWRNAAKEYKSKQQENPELKRMLEEEDVHPEELPLSIALELLYSKGPYDPIFNPEGKRNYGHLFVRLVCYWKNATFIMSQGNFIFIVFYLAVSIMGVAIIKITYCFHLLDVVNRFATLRNVVRSVTYNLNQLLLTGLLGLILIYIYALVGFYFVDETYYNGDAGSGGERTCTSMIHCYMTTLNYGLRNGGGIGESLTFLTYASDNRVAYFFRLIFDLSFFIIINVVFLNIIFGIIIDTFAELRDQKNMIDEDMNTICFICNLDRYTFDKNGTGFENHIEKNHHLWNYLFFIYSVQVKDPTEYNGIESYVQEKLDNEDSSWFPLHKAIELEEAKEE